MVVSKKSDENPCNPSNPKAECGRCGLPDPMNTDTLGHARLGIRYLLGRPFQAGIVNKFGKDQAKAKLQCEFTRVMNVLKNEYHDTSAWTKKDFLFWQDLSPADQERRAKQYKQK